MATLLLISTPGGLLTYEDSDIVDCMEADKNPGRAVTANEGGHWTFVYITDKTCHETMMLRQPRVEGEGEEQTQTAKRRFCCVLPKESEEVCKTYRTLAAAPAEQKFTWAEFEATLCADKDA